MCDPMALKRIHLINKIDLSHKNCPLIMTYNNHQFYSALQFLRSPSESNWLLSDLFFTSSDSPAVQTKLSWSVAVWSGWAGGPQVRGAFRKMSVPLSPAGLCDMAPAWC